MGCACSTDVALSHDELAQWVVNRCIREWTPQSIQTLPLQIEWLVYDFYGYAFQPPSQLSPLVMEDVLHLQQRDKVDYRADDGKCCLSTVSEIEHSDRGVRIVVQEDITQALHQMSLDYEDWSNARIFAAESISQTHTIHPSLSVSEMVVVRPIFHGHIKWTKGEIVWKDKDSGQALIKYAYVVRDADNRKSSERFYIWSHLDSIDEVKLYSDRNRKLIQ